MGIKLKNPSRDEFLNAEVGGIEPHPEKSGPARYQLATGSIRCQPPMPPQTYCITTETKTTSPMKKMLFLVLITECDVS